MLQMQKSRDRLDQYREYYTQVVKYWTAVRSRNICEDGDGDGSTAPTGKDVGVGKDEGERIVVGSLENAPGMLTPPMVRSRLLLLSVVVQVLIYLVRRRKVVRSCAKVNACLTAICAAATT